MTSTPPLADTADYIAFHAAVRPRAVALVADGRAVSYAEMSRHLAKFVAAVRDFVIAPGGRVAVGCEAVYAHWLLLAACERLGIVTASFGKEEGARLRELLTDMDLVLAEPGLATEGARRTHVITPGWIQGVFAAPGLDTGIPRGVPKDPARIIRTSGTTGTPKRIALTRGMYHAWTERWAWSLGITGRTRYLLTMPFVSTGRHTLTNAVLRAGGTVVAERFDSSADSIAHAALRHSINLMTLLPVQLKLILDMMPADFAKPADLTVATIGAAAAESLVEKTVTRLATEVVSYYGSNEIPFIAEMRLPASERRMTVFPWIELEIVDDRGSRVPEGEAGWVRIKSDTMPAGYLDEPESTRRMFRDGWFHPGDMGVLRGRRLHVIGRGDELMNIGGQKLAPGDIEALVARHLEAADIGVCSLPNAQGIEELYVALARPQGEDADLLRRLAQAFAGYAFGDIRPVKLEGVPRNANGKILRNALKEAVEKATRAGRT